MSIVVGIVGIVAGVLVLGRFLLIPLVGEAPMVLLRQALRQRSRETERVT